MKKRGFKRLGKNELEILEELSGGDLLIGFLSSGRTTRRMYTIARERALQRYRTKQTVDRLLAKGWVIRDAEKISITAAGRSMLDTTIARVRTLLEKTGWDGKWRIVAFDIPEKWSSLRRQVRSILKRAGFMELQHSVWIFPHECKELSDFIRNDKRLLKNVLYGVLEHIDDSERLQKIFSLNKI